MWFFQKVLTSNMSIHKQNKLSNQVHIKRLAFIHPIGSFFYIIVCGRKVYSINTIHTHNNDMPRKTLTYPVRGLSWGHFCSGGPRFSMATWSGKWRYFTGILVYLICFVAFAIQLGNLIGNYVKPTITSTNVEEKELKEIGFPLIVKICVKPGFNQNAIQDAGYRGPQEFFFVQSKINRLELIS